MTLTNTSVAVYYTVYSFAGSIVYSGVFLMALSLSVFLLFYFLLLKPPLYEQKLAAYTEMKGQIFWRLSL